MCHACADGIAHRPPCLTGFLKSGSAVGLVKPPTLMGGGCSLQPPRVVIPRWRHALRLHRWPPPVAYGEQCRCWPDLPSVRIWSWNTRSPSAFGRQIRTGIGLDNGEYHFRNRSETAASITDCPHGIPCPVREEAQFVEKPGQASGARHNGRCTGPEFKVRGMERDLDGELAQGKATRP